MRLPIFAPVPVPAPVPYRVQPRRGPNRVVPPWTQPHRGPVTLPGTGGQQTTQPHNPGAEVNPGSVINPVPPPFIPPKLPPYEVPADVVVIEQPTAGGGKPATKPKPGRSTGSGVKASRGSHQKRAPRRKEKELKGVSKKLRTALSIVSENVGIVTEFYDLVRAFYNALPWELRRFKGRNGKWMDRDITPQDMLERIYRHLPDLHAPSFYARAAVNIMENEGEDRLIGAFANLAKRTNTKTGGRVVGLAAGPAI